MATTDIDIMTLNTLIETTIESVDCFEQAAVAADDDDLARLFRRCAMERRPLVADLRAQVRALGSMPEADGTVLTGGDRSFFRAKGAFGGSRKAVIEEVETREGQLRGEYDRALREMLLPETRRVIELAYGSVRAGKGVFSVMRHSFPS